MEKIYSFHFVIKVKLNREQMADAKKNPLGGDKPAKNIVHEQAILVETIRKELREQKLTEHFSINPFTKSTRIF